MRGATGLLNSHVSLHGVMNAVSNVKPERRWAERRSDTEHDLGASVIKHRDHFTLQLFTKIAGNCT
jgi:hypothetical protein